MMNSFTLDPAHIPVEFHKGDNFKSALERIGIHFPGNCGGRGRCRMCRLEIQSRTEETLESRQAFGCLEKAFSGAVIKVIPPAIESRMKDVVFELPAFPGRGFCAVVDLGTTVVAVHLLNRETGVVFGQRSFLNPQLYGGGDVISRLDSALHKGQFEAMSAMIHKAIGECIVTMAKEATGMAINSLEVLVVGNSAMTQLFLGISDPGLAVFPFRSTLEGRGCITFQVRNIEGIEVATSRTAPIISGFIGGDTVAAIFAAELDKAEAGRLLIDFGTNCEVVLNAGDRLFAVSCAAGPAFEGVGLHCGMAAIEGAISGIDSAGAPIVIGDSEPLGICGSGYIALLGYYLQNEMIRHDGRIRNAGNSIMVCQGKFSEIVIDQEDIRKLQFAKAAVRSGIQEVCHCAGVEEDRLEQIILTGSFGMQIDGSQAMRIGLLPSNFNCSIVHLPSAASFGGLKALSTPGGLEILENIASSVHVINMAEQSSFEDRFVSNLTFGNQNFE